MSYLGAGADWRKRNYLIEPEVSACANTGAVNRVENSLFVASSGVITFNEVALLTPNPLITAAMYGGAVNVQCGPMFLNQSDQTIFDPQGPGYLKGVVAAPLTVNTTGAPRSAYTVNDPAWGADPRTLSGDPDFTLGLPFVMGFSSPVVGVQFTLGGFNETQACRVRAYDVDGNILGTWTNEEIVLGVPAPFETFSLNRDSNVGIISGVSIEINMNTPPFEANGVVMKNVSFSATCL